MDESPRRNLITPILALVILGAGVYFFANYKISGLDGISIEPHSGVESSDPYAEGFEVTFPTNEAFNSAVSNESANPISAASYGGLTNAGETGSLPNRPQGASQSPLRPSKNLRVGSWAMGGLTASKFNDDAIRINLVRVARQFDVLALQQIRSPERDLVPRLVDAMNEGGRHYDYVLAAPSTDGPSPERLAVIFDIDSARVDRTQTYTVADPAGVMTHAPMVTWFRASGPGLRDAWTFSLVNVHVELTRAAAEVSVLPQVFASVREDGRGEDDVVMAGLFQADDRYLIPAILGAEVEAAVKSVPTDVAGDHQTSNIVMHRKHTSEFLGRGGVVDFLRRYNLSIDQAQAVSTNLPVFAEFTLAEGGQL